MATKSKQGTKSKPVNDATPDATKPAQSGPAKEDATIHKGVYLSALVYVEGDRPAPQDFTAEATSALKKALAPGDGDLRFSVKKVDVQNNIDEVSGGSKSKASKETSDKEGDFQF